MNLLRRTVIHRQPAYIAISLVAGLFSMLAGDSQFSIAGYVNALLCPAAYIYSGSYIAPSRHSATAVILMVLYVIVTAALWGFIAFGVATGNSEQSVLEPAIRSAVSVVILVACCIHIVQADARTSEAK